MADLQSPLRELDRHFADFIQQLAGEDCAPLYWAAALASRAAGQGHVCIHLNHYADQLLEAAPVPVQLPTYQEWLEQLQRFPGIVGGAGDFTPLILEDKRVYLGRYWSLEQGVAEMLKQRAAAQMAVAEGAAGLLERLFPSSAQQPDWQKVAAAMALIKSLLVISGGPGTGKTSTVVKVLALILGLDKQQARMVLCAPTGKAAHRLQQSISGAVNSLSVEDELKSRLQFEVQTLHRLLGIRADGGSRHNADNPLHADIVVVDEVSMVDLGLMHQLLQALPQEARLILLGDRNQLASVEAGSVLGDICAKANSEHYSVALLSQLQTLSIDLESGSSPVSTINDCIVQLQHSYRFKADSGIGRLASATLQGDVPSLQAALNGTDVALQYHELAVEQLTQGCGELIQQHYLPWGNMTPEQALEAMQALQLLAVTREGPLGVKTVNTTLEQVLRQRRKLRETETWYPGRPVIILRNDYRMNLFNGDMGITLPDPDKPGQMRVWFRDQQGTLHGHHPARLPQHETAYAITVHKSQGSEYDQVILLLPQQPTPLLSRELLYTAVSRARHGFQAWGPMQRLQEGLQQGVERHSGLIEKLWQDD